MNMNGNQLKLCCVQLDVWTLTDQAQLKWNSIFPVLLYCLLNQAAYFPMWRYSLLQNGLQEKQTKAVKVNSFNLNFPSFLNKRPKQCVNHETVERVIQMLEKLSSIFDLLSNYTIEKNLSV